MAIGTKHLKAAELNSTGLTYIALPVNSASISEKTYNSSRTRSLGQDVPRVLTGGFKFGAKMEVAESTGATAAYKTILEWFITTKGLKTIRFLDPSSVVGAASYSGDFAIESIDNWFQVDAGSADPKLITVNLVGGSDLTVGVVATPSGLSATYAPVPKYQGIIKVTSGTLITLADIKSATSKLSRTTQPYHKINNTAPSSATQGGLEGEVTLTVLVDPSTGSDYSKLLALVGAGPVACEFYSPTAAASSGGNKFTGSFSVTTIGTPVEGVANDANTNTASFKLELDSTTTFTYTQV